MANSPRPTRAPCLRKRIGLTCYVSNRRHCPEPSRSILAMAAALALFVRRALESHAASALARNCQAGFVASDAREVARRRVAVTSKAEDRNFPKSGSQLVSRRLARQRSTYTDRFDSRRVYALFACLTFIAFWISYRQQQHLSVRIVTTFAFAAEPRRCCCSLIVLSYL